MKHIINFILAVSLLLSLNSFSYSKSGTKNKSKKETTQDARLVNPLYELSARNLVAGASPLIDYNIYYFDLVISHTNLPESGPFQYAAGQFTLTYSWLIRLFGIPTYEIVENSSDFTNPDALPINPTVVGNKLILERNPDLKPGEGPIIAPDGTGTRIVRMKLTTRVPAFFNIPLNLKWVDSPTDSASTEVYAFIGDSVTNISSGGSLFIDSGNVSALNLKAAISGLYDAENNRLRARDTLRVYQHSVIPPYNVVDSSSAIIDTLTFRGIFNFKNATTGIYYTVVKYKNGLETWSRLGGDSLKRGSQVSYDFTDDSTKAFGNNLQKKGNIYCIYNGDVNQNGIIDLADLTLIDNSIRNFISGFSVEDVNGDNFVDLTDAQLTDNLALSFISVIRP
ncbi:MAG: hypothetical protein JSS91_07235 [Bacteroidetes bacterium]|nr:hypothetical protein [Bacteroidota bacterium]